MEFHHSVCVCVLGLRLERTRGTCASIGYDALSVRESMNFILHRVSELDSFSECGTTLHKPRAVDKVGAMC